MARLGATQDLPLQVLKFLAVCFLNLGLLIQVSYCVSSAHLVLHQALFMLKYEQYDDCSWLWR